MFVCKPGENSENIEITIKTFDEAVNDIFPSVACECGLDPEEFNGREFDAHTYIGDEGGALWSGLCKAKGDDIKNETVSDFSISNKISVDTFNTSKPTNTKNTLNR